MGNREKKHPCAFDTLFTKSVPHVLEEIFFSLDYESFKISMKVSKSWNELLTSESFKKIGKSVYREDIERELYKASEDGNLKEVKSVLSIGMAVVNYDLGPPDGTPLGVALLKGHKDVVQTLLDRGAEPNKANTAGQTPLQLAAHSGHKDVVQSLLDIGVEPNKADNFGGAPLHHAAFKGHKFVAELLLNRGAEINQADHWGWTPLHDAAYEGYRDVVTLLLNRGADLNHVDADGRTPLTLALDNGWTDIINILKGGGA